VKQHRVVVYFLADVNLAHLFFMFVVPHLPIVTHHYYEKHISNNLLMQINKLLGRIIKLVLDKKYCWGACPGTAPFALQNRAYVCIHVSHHSIRSFNLSDPEVFDCFPVDGFVLCVGVHVSAVRALTPIGFGCAQLLELAHLGRRNHFILHSSKIVLVPLTS
jgi:hypothetical protein